MTKNSDTTHPHRGQPTPTAAANLWVRSRDKESKGRRGADTGWGSEWPSKKTNPRRSPRKKGGLMTGVTTAKEAENHKKRLGGRKPEPQTCLGGSSQTSTKGLYGKSLPARLSEKCNKEVGKCHEKKGETKKRGCRGGRNHKGRDELGLRGDG